MRLGLLLSNWTYQEFLEFQSAYQQGNPRRAFELVSKIVIDWDLDVDPSNREAMMDVKIAEATKVMREVIARIDEMTQQFDLNEVVVDLDAWTTRRFFEFNDALVDRNFRRLEPMLHEVASIEGVDPNEPLNAVHGAMMQVAVATEYRKVVEGKN